MSFTAVHINVFFVVSFRVFSYLTQKLLKKWERWKGGFLSQQRETAPASLALWSLNRDDDGRLRGQFRKERKNPILRVITTAASCWLLLELGKWQEMGVFLGLSLRTLLLIS